MYKKLFSVFALLLVASMGFALAEQGGVGEGEGSSEQTQEKIQVQEGEHLGEGGQTFRIQTQANNRIKLEAGGISAECDCQMTQETVQDKTKLYAGLSNGQNAEIKVMPNTASEKALNQLKLKTCSEENECSIELKEVGSGEQTKLAYELKTQRHSRVFGIFGAKMQVQAQVHAETGEIVRVKKPWWAFLALEPEEE